MTNLLSALNPLWLRSLGQSFLGQDHSSPGPNQLSSLSSSINCDCFNLASLLSYNSGGGGGREEIVMERETDIMKINLFCVEEKTVL